MDTTNLVAWLSFDDSPTFDWCGNEWTTYGTPTIGTDGAIKGKALQLNGNNYIQCDSIAAKIGSDIWTIHWHATCTATRTEGYFFGTYNANYGTSGMGNNKWVSVCYLNGNPKLVLYGNDVQAGVSLTLGQRYHYALSYDGTNLRFFIDGQLKITKAANVKLGGIFRIGNDPCRSNQFTGSIDEFMILKGVAWTENFTPPTAEDYDISDGFPINFTVDLRRKVNNPRYVLNPNLKAYLSFDGNATYDLCGNTWTAYGTPTVSETNATSGKALQLDGKSSYLRINGGITLGGKSFTIHLWCAFSSASGAAALFFCVKNSQTGTVLDINRYGTWDAFLFWYPNGTENKATDFYRCNYDTPNHFAIVYEHERGVIHFFLNGSLLESHAVTIEETFFDNVQVGGTTLVGTIDEVQVFDGVALWSENFNPSTAANYAFVEVQRVKIKPEIFASWIPTSGINFKPEVFASWIPTGEINFKPEIFATLIGEDIICEFNADLRRKLVNTNDFNADLKRTLVVSETFSADLRRSLTNKVNFSFDLRRKIINRVEFSVDLKRTIIAPVDFTVDLRRSLVNTVDFTFDLHAHIYWQWLTRILPESSFLDPKIYASAEALDAQITAFHLAIREVLHLPRLNELSGTILDLLAEQFHVDAYDAINFSDEEKRNLIRQSIAWHRLKGTPAAVEMVLQDAFKDLRIDEWFTYGGEPYYFRLWCRGYISTPERFKSFWLMFMDAKNVRSHLEMVTIDYSHEEPIQLYTGVAKVTSGLKFIGLPKLNDAKINLYTGVATVKTGTKIIGLPKLSNISTKIYSGVYTIHTGTIFIGMKRNPF